MSVWLYLTDTKELQEKLFSIVPSVTNYSANDTKYKAIRNIQQRYGWTEEADNSSSLLDPWAMWFPPIQSLLEIDHKQIQDGKSLIRRYFAFLKQSLLDGLLVGSKGTPNTSLTFSQFHPDFVNLNLEIL